tara:strand:- start:150 stop:752 length:603 start_codon:yes stop_codon:yes gene_type:complete
MGIRILAFIIFTQSVNLEARPVSYPSGSTLMAFSNQLKESIYYHYSPSYKYSVGVESLKDKFQKKNYSYLRFTYLLNRTNTTDSQLNIYFQSGIRFDNFDDSFFGLRGDWETRRWYMDFNYKEQESNNLSYTDQYCQIGLAPYLGEYGDLHTWVMLKARRNSRNETWSVYPVIKFFKGNLLFESGYSKDNQWDIHLMYRF